MEIEVKNLSMEFQAGSKVVPVFSALNLRIDSGSSIAILGESGVGKTTLLYILGGLEIPTSGDVLLDQVNIARKLRENEDISVFRGRNIGMVFQFHYLLQEFDALENVLMPLRIRGSVTEESEDRAAGLLERVGLKDRMSHRPGALSGGEQQRVALARAVISNPGILLADEPTGNLDGKNGQQIMDLIAELQEENGLTVVMVTHSVDLAERLNRRVLMSQDELIEGI